MQKSHFTFHDYDYDYDYSCYIPRLRLHYSQHNTVVWLPCYHLLSYHHLGILREYTFFPCLKAFEIAFANCMWRVLKVAVLKGAQNSLFKPGTSNVGAMISMEVGPDLVLIQCSFRSSWGGPHKISKTQNWKWQQHDINNTSTSQRTSTSSIITHPDQAHYTCTQKQ